MIEAQAGFPYRVPDAVRELFDVGPVTMYEQDVEVAAGRELGTPVTADGDEGDIGFVAQQLREPSVRETRQGLAQCQAPAGLVGQEFLACCAKSRRGPSRRCGPG